MCPESPRAPEPEQQAGGLEASENQPEPADVDPYDLTETAKVRHLTQITEPRPAKKLPPKKKRQARMRYRFDTFMAKGGASIFKVLTLVFLGTFLLIGLLRGALLMMFPEIPQQHDELDFFGNLYITFLEITDPGNMAQDIYSNVAYKIFAILAGICRHRHAVRADRVHYDSARSEDPCAETRPLEGHRNRPHPDSGLERAAHHRDSA